MSGSNAGVAEAGAGGKVAAPGGDLAKAVLQQDAVSGGLHASQRAPEVGILRPIAEQDLRVLKRHMAAGRDRDRRDDGRLDVRADGFQGNRGSGGLDGLDRLGNQDQESHDQQACDRD